MKLKDLIETMEYGVSCMLTSKNGCDIYDIFISSTDIPEEVKPYLDKKIVHIYIDEIPDYYLGATYDKSVLYIEIE